MTNNNKNCRICNNNIKPFMSFGDMPIANGFLKKNQFENEYFFKMQTAFCNSCKTFQLIDQPEPTKMFNDNYPFFSSLSKYMKIHFEKFSENILENYVKDKNNSFVIEIGSNDGIMLKNFKENNIKHLGIEPSTNVAKVAKDKGIETISKFFDENLAEEILKKYGKADAMFSANCICHIPNLNSVFRGVNKLLKDDGVFAYEDPYLAEMLKKTSYDQIYDEHVFIFSITSVNNIAKLNGLELFDAQKQITHGGSMRYMLAKKGSRKISENIRHFLKEEEELNMNTEERYLLFKNQCEKSKKDLVDLLQKLKKQNKRVIGYGATSKSTTILNYSNINESLIEFISDTTPLKQNKFSPGMHIPIKDYDSFKSNYPDYAVLFAWNHKKEIFDKEIDFVKNGGKWIHFIPEVSIEP